MQKRALEPNQDGDQAGKTMRVEGTAAGVVKKPGPRLPLIMYKEGEPLNLMEYYNKPEGDNTLEVRIPAHCLVQSNRQVRARQLWGKGPYTHDSDLVAALMQCGYWLNSLTHAPPLIADARVVIKLHPSQPSYSSLNRNNIRSRAWYSPIEDGCSFSIEKAWAVTRSGTTMDLAPTPENMQPAVPTFTPALLERITTRSAGAGAKQRNNQELTVIYNLVNEPWPKYTMMAVADRGLKPHEWTSARLQIAVLYMESYKERFELARKGNINGVEVYQFSRCKKLLMEANMRRVGIPLPAKEKEVLYDDLKWEEMGWGVNGVTINEREFQLVRVRFMEVKVGGEKAENGK